MREAVSLRDLYQTYGDRVRFLVIYIREAHPTDGWELDAGPKMEDPKTIDERRAAAGECATAMEYGIKTYVDEMDDAVMNAYVAWPERLYLVDTDGVIAYAGGKGPGGFSPEELKEAIERLLSSAGG